MPQADNTLIRINAPTTTNVVHFPVAPRPVPTRKKAARAARRRAMLLSKAEETAAIKTDPIFRAIAIHLAAVVAKLDHTDRTSGMSFEEEEQEEALSSELWDRCDETLSVVLGTAPTTLEGVAALLEHVALQEFLDPDDKTSGRETFLSSYDECSGKWKRLGQDFPLRVAETIRGLMGSAPSAA
jgi:hypothetical protein